MTHMRHGKNNSVFASILIWDEVNKYLCSKGIWSWSMEDLHIHLCCLCSVCVCVCVRVCDWKKRELFFLPQRKLSRGWWWKNQMDSLLGWRTFPVWLDELWPLEPSVKQEYDAALSGNGSCEENYLVIEATKGLDVDSLFAVMTLWAPTPKAEAPCFIEKSDYMIHTKTVLYMIHVHLQVHVSCRGQMAVKDKWKCCHSWL